jgi:hypothetical protein
MEPLTTTTAVTSTWTILNTINALIVGIGIPTGVGALIYIGRKLQILDDLSGVRERFAIVESRVSDLWKDRLAPASSPRQLNAVGKNVLDASGIKEIIDHQKDHLLNIVRDLHPTNPYDAEKVIMDVMSQFPDHCPDDIDRLKTGAFNAGVDLGAVLFVGAIYLRNLIFKDLGFALDDIDKHAPV